MKGSKKSLASGQQRNDSLLPIVEASAGGSSKATATSVFAGGQFKQVIANLEDEVRALYTADDSPWIVGYSGGKDSTATLQLVWTAIASLPPGKRTKEIHVISTDTLVENPIVAMWVAKSLDTMRDAAAASGMPIRTHRLAPELANSFWVNLIGRGYPAPRHKFRWCTERLKIRPSNAFITSVVKASGEAILVLGIRKAESSRRAANMKKHEARRVRDRLSPNASLPGSLVYSPIEDWTNDDVWFFLMQSSNPWGYSNRELLGMYAGASADGECPLVVDSSTPSCGDSRFGCWVCTLVDEDKSMTAMIQNDDEKQWMLPLLELRNALDFRSGVVADGDEIDSTDRDLRDFRRMSGSVQLMSDGRPIPGPYIQSARESWLRKLLEAQVHIQKHGPRDCADLTLISIEELQEIRRIWVIDKHELEDSLPRIYQEATRAPYPGGPLDDDMVLGNAEMADLAESCGDDRLHYELCRELLSLTNSQKNVAKRSGLFSQLERAFERHFYVDESDAVSRAAEVLRKRREKRGQRAKEDAPLFKGDDE
jgi:DNA sulfur modification protein DndC